MKRLLLVLILLISVGLQAKNDIGTKAENMRLFGNEAVVSKTNKSNIQKNIYVNYLTGDYLICVLAIGAYIMIKRKKSRRIDL